MKSISMDSRGQSIESFGHRSAEPEPEQQRDDGYGSQRTENGPQQQQQLLGGGSKSSDGQFQLTLPPTSNEDLVPGNVTLLEPSDSLSENDCEIARGGTIYGPSHLSLTPTSNEDSDPDNVVSPGPNNIHPPSDTGSGGVSSASGEPDASPEQESRLWKSSWKRWGPFAGLLCMFTALCSVTASLGILIASDGSATTAWPFEPSAYLALFTSIANQSLRIAIVHGVAITWWSKALKGTTLTQLHYEYVWLHGIPGWASLRNEYSVTLVGVACLASMFVALDGPLLQKASSVVSVPITNMPINLNVNIAPEVPHGFTGSWNRGRLRMPYQLFEKHIPTSDGTVLNNLVVGYDPRLTNIQRQFVTEPDISGFVTGCATTCRLKLRAPAVAISSSVSHVIPVNYMATATKYQNSSAFIPQHSEFATYVGLLLNEPHERINLLTGYSTTRNCSGVFNYTISTLQSAIGEYDVLVTNGSVQPSALGVPRIVAISNNTKSNNKQNTSYESTLGGIVAIAQCKYVCAVQVELLNGQMVEVMFGTETTAAAFVAWNDMSNCQSYGDPTSAILQDLNALMFRVGVFAAQTLSPTEMSLKLDPGLDREVNTTVVGQVQGMHNVYKTDLYWFMGAALVEIVCICLILPTYFGWWRIGRPISFSPLEIAKAFDAPLFSECNSNATGRDIAKAIGDVRVKYGAVSALSSDSIGQHHLTRLAFGRSEDVYQPGNNSRFDG